MESLSGAVRICGHSVVVSCSVARCGCFCQAIPYGTCWGSWLQALSCTMVVLNPPTTHMSPCFASSGFITSMFVLRMPSFRSLSRICPRMNSSVFISPPMRNLHSPIGLLGLVTELLCSKFRMSWHRCASVSFGLPDGACTLTTSMPSSLRSPGMVHKKVCAVR